MTKSEAKKIIRVLVAGCTEKTWAGSQNGNGIEIGSQGTYIKI